MAAARITRSLDTLRSQVNALAPGRSKASDGWLGDAKHSMRKSDHNPEPDGTVDALDITHDPQHGVDIQKLCDAIVASRDRRVSYVICNGKIIAGNSGPKPWVKRKYSGANKHTRHLHISVLDAHQDETTPWKIDGAFARAAPSADAAQPAAKAPVPAKWTPATAPAAPEADMAHGDPLVWAIQEQLLALGYPEVGTIDGRFGTKTRGAILAFEADNGLPLTGKATKAVLAEMLVAAPRAIAPERAEATPKEVREEVPEVRSNFFAKVWGMLAGAGAMIAAAFNWLAENFAAVREKAQPVLDVAGDIPIWLYLAVFGGFAFVLWRSARKGEAKGVEAYQAGERR